MILVTLESVGTFRGSYSLWMTSIVPHICSAEPDDFSDPFQAGQMNKISKLTCQRLPRGNGGGTVQSMYHDVDRQGVKELHLNVTSRLSGDHAKTKM